VIVLSLPKAIGTNSVVGLFAEEVGLTRVGTVESYNRTLGEAMKQDILIKDGHPRTPEVLAFVSSEITKFQDWAKRKCYSPKILFV